MSIDTQNIYITSGLYNDPQSGIPNWLGWSPLLNSVGLSTSVLRCDNKMQDFHFPSDCNHILANHTVIS